MITMTKSQGYWLCTALNTSTTQSFFTGPNIFTANYYLKACDSRTCN